jgi:hypothetical protein
MNRKMFQFLKKLIWWVAFVRCNKYRSIYLFHINRCVYSESEVNHILRLVGIGALSQPLVDAVGRSTLGLFAQRSLRRLGIQTEQMLEIVGDGVDGRVGDRGRGGEQTSGRGRRRLTLKGLAGIAGRCAGRDGRARWRVRFQHLNARRLVN